MKCKTEKSRRIEIRYDPVLDPELEDALEGLKRHYQQATATSVIKMAVTKHTQMLSKINDLRVALARQTNENKDLKAAIAAFTSSLSVLKDWDTGDRAGHGYRER